MKSKRSNAFKHGAYAHYAVLPGESEEEFQSLYSNLVDELQPKGTLEEEIVSSIAMLCFHKWRICEMLYDELYVADLPPFYHNVQIIKEMSENLNLCSTRKEVADYLSVLEGEPYFYIIRDQINEKKDLEMSAYAEHVKMVLQDAAEHLIEQVNQEKSAPLHRERRAELKHKISLKYMATLERLEAMIDRQFKRLAHLKGYKEMIAFLQAPQIKTTPEASIR